mgnify:CR=1 FL=1
MAEIDLKDRKILFELSKNCRLPTTQIAKRVGLSQQVVDYRINRLIKNKIISDFITEINLEKLGYGRHIMYIQLKKVDEKNEKEIVDYFINHPFLTWVATSTGKWSVIFDIIAKNLKQVNEIVEEIKDTYGDFFGEYSVASQIDYQYFHSKYYGFKEDKQMIKESGRKYDIDEIDLKLLYSLSNNARADLVYLSKQLDLTANGVKHRLKNLIESSVIKSFFIEPNKTLLGYEQYNIQFTFENINKEQETRFIDYIKNHPNVNFYYIPIGPWDLEIGIFVKNPGELRKIILDMRNQFSDIIKIFDTVIYYEEPKSNFIPSGVFKNL